MELAACWGSLGLRGREEYLTPDKELSGRFRSRSSTGPARPQLRELQRTVFKSLREGSKVPHGFPYGLLGQSSTLLMFCKYSCGRCNDQCDKLRQYQDDYGAIVFGDNHLPSPG